MNNDDNIMRELSLDDLEAVNGGVPDAPGQISSVFDREKPFRSIDFGMNGSETNERELKLPATTLKEG